MGAEIGISTDKIGARGPMGLDELTSYKWLGIGNGQIRTWAAADVRRLKLDPPLTSKGAAGASLPRPLQDCEVAAKQPHFIRDSLPPGGLFAGLDWRVSPAPFPLGAEL